MNTKHDELYDLLEALLEDTLTADQAARLEQLVLTDAEARRVYVEYLHQHATLRWHRGADAAGLDAALEGDGSPVRSLRWLKYAAAAMVALLVGVVGTQMWGHHGEFATLTETRSAQWSGGTLPTEPGSRLSAGRLRLAGGLATIRFDNGAQLTIEGPSDLELMSKSRCVLHAGGLTANVPPPAIGFTVDTPRAVVVDHGTAFGVSVDDKGEGRVQVFEGIVDVKHHGQKDKQRLTTGRAVRVGESELQKVADAEGDDEGRVGRTEQSQLPAEHSVRITTATGRGRDAYIKSPRTDVKHDSDVLLLVKNAPGPKGFSRKAYMSFDLSGIRGRTVREARLQLTMLPTGWGFASGLPDCEFDVYGVTDEAQDDWSPERMTWTDVPAASEDGGLVDTSRAKLLGTFKVPQGVQQGVYEVSGRAVAEFLSRDTNGVATFIVVRRTAEVRAGSLVHGFASSRHPTAAPPTLRIETE